MKHGSARVSKARAALVSLPAVVREKRICAPGLAMQIDQHHLGLAPSVATFSQIDARLLKTVTHGLESQLVLGLGFELVEIADGGELAVVGEFDRLIKDHNAEIVQEEAGVLVLR